MPGNIEVFKRLKAAINIPLAAGERDRTIWGMIPYLQERCLDILQPDCNHTGGISQMKKIATLAEAYHVPLAPHCTATLLGIAQPSAGNVTIILPPIPIAPVATKATVARVETPGAFAPVANVLFPLFNGRTTK